MKKLLMFVAVAVLVLTGQAAQFNWQYNATSADVGKTVYVLLGSTAQTSWESVDALADAAVSSGTVAKKVNKYNTSGTAVDDAITKTSASVYYVIVSKDGTSFDVTSVSDMSASVYDPAAQETSPGNNTSLSSASITSSGNSFSGGGESGGGAPEPTSGILLLVGGAMLALRRKQK